jgi:NAD(P)-dependent dehydrogenase (short-subunit alcohol dehydrogenase family)
MDTRDLFSLSGRTALVTGGSRGIGKMIAAGFIAQGAKVYITSRKAEACAATAAELGPACRALRSDVATVEGCSSLLTAYSEFERTLDILVNNAGMAWGAPFETFPESGWDNVMTLNVKSPFFLTQKFHPLLRKAGSPERPAKVINIASVDSVRLNHWDTFSYHASKSAIVHLTRRLAARLVTEHINVTAILPGAFPSDMNRPARDRADIVGKLIPAGRIGRPEDVAAAAIYLAAQSGDYVVGSTVTVDGGTAYAELGVKLEP